MSASLSVAGYASKESPEFQKHYKAVKFCIENELSFPKETSEFFAGKVDGEDLEDIEPSAILECLADGIEVDCSFICNEGETECTITVSEIPKEVDKIIIRMT